MNKLYLVSNDKIWISKKKYTSNNDLNNIINCLKKNFDLRLINRQSFEKLDFKIDKDILILKPSKIKKEKIKILLISITPYNFLILFYFVYIKKLNVCGHVYLRSDGFLEYKYRFGWVGYYFYNLMFNFVTSKLKIISCSKNFTKVKVDQIIHPSELNKTWFNYKISKKINYVDFLYVGRFKKDKGAYFLVKFFKKHLQNYNLKIVGTHKKLIPQKYYSKNIIFQKQISNIYKLIETYDSAKIFILPSYIEGFPKVISEALARSKPIIIFEEIKYVINDRYGIFVSKRNITDLKIKINFILRNYELIQKKIKKNYFFTNENFKKELLEMLYK